MPSARASQSWLYAIMRRTFWLLPAALRCRLHGIRHELVHWFRSRAQSGGQVELGKGDLDWSGFLRQVLSRTAEYRNVIVFEPNVDWGIVLFQRPQHMAVALGRLGCLVIYKTTGDDLAGFRRVAENVWLANDNAVGSLEGACRCYFSTSLLGSADELRAARMYGPVIYEYIDHVDASISGGRPAFKRLQSLKCAALEGSADLVISSAVSLHEEAVIRLGRDRCVYVPNGVDVEHYRDPRHLAVSLPASLLKFKKSYSVVVGYFGAIAPWLWYDTIDIVTARMPDVGFVFIGPDYSGCVPKLPRRDNVHYAGTVEYSILPAYAQTFDICFIPFLPGAVARSTSPLKLFEYFALEKPVVVTADMAECVSFPEVFSGSDAVSLVEAIQKAMLVRGDDAFKTRLRDLASNNSWAVRASYYSDTISKMRGK